MPKVRELKGGGFIIKTFRGTSGDTDSGWYGTWQVPSRAEELLEQHHCCYEGASVPIDLFFDLVEQRLIWNESGTYPQRPSKNIPTNMAVQEISLILRLKVTSSTWSLAFSCSEQPKIAAKVAANNLVLERNPHVTVEFNGSQFRSPRSVEQVIATLSSELVPQADEYIIYVRRGQPMPSSLEILARAPGMRPRGNFFESHGLPLVSPPVSGATCFLVIRSDHVWSGTGERRIPAALRSKRLGRNGRWECWQITMPANPSHDVRMYFRERVA